jgi:hypothetical protein
MNILDQKRQLEAKIAELNKEMKSKRDEMFAEIFNPLFEKYPHLTSISWTAYTPYFNDGDSCTFGSHHDDADFNYYKYEDGELINTEDSEDVPYIPWRLEGKEDDLTKELFAARQEFRELVDVFTDDDMEVFFGDHVSVVLTKGRIDVEEYDHD